MRLKSIAILPAVVILAGCDLEDMVDSGRYHEDFHYNYPLKTGGRIAVESFNGGIEISTWDQPNVDISGTRYARSQEAISEDKIDIDHTSDAVSIRATRPTMRNGNYGARFVIKAPRSAVLDRITTSNGAIRAVDAVGPARFRTSNGGIHVTGLQGSLNAETSNGVVELADIDGEVTAHTSNGAVRGKEIRGPLDVSTSNGSIDMAVSPGPTPAVSAHTSNGAITLRFAGEPNARLSASTSNSSISSDFEMMVRGEVSKHRMEGTLGRGGPTVNLQTSNGGIRIVRAGSTRGAEASER
jgi:hypothetical protein